MDQVFVKLGRYVEDQQLQFIKEMIQLLGCLIGFKVATFKTVFDKKPWDIR